MASDSGGSDLGFSYKSLFGNHLYSYLEGERKRVSYLGGLLAPHPSFRYSKTPLIFYRNWTLCEISVCKEGL